MAFTRRWTRSERLPDDQIDTTEISEILDWPDAKRGLFYRSVKQQITLRLDADIVIWFKRHAQDGRGYQKHIAILAVPRDKETESGVIQRFPTVGQAANPCRLDFPVPLRLIGGGTP